MSCPSPNSGNCFDFESLFEDEALPNLYQSPTGSLVSTSTDNTNSSHEQAQPPITYDVISDGYVFGNEFDLSPTSLAQKQKSMLKQDDLAAANPFFNQAMSAGAAQNAFPQMNQLSGFVYPPGAKQQAGFVGYNPQFMGQLGMYFPQTFPFPQFGGQPFPNCFPNNSLMTFSPNTSPILPGTVNTSPITNSTATTSPTQPNTTTETTTKKAARRKSTKKSSKSSSNTSSTSNQDDSISGTKATTPEVTVITETPQPTITTPESMDSDVSSPSSEKEDNDSTSSSGKKSDTEKKRKRKSKNGKALTPEEEKELKRQRRLIKNRESAQASRERKKVYIQGLEKKVDGLQMDNVDLQVNLTTLEQENETLRQRLRMLGEVVEEPTQKKRKMTPHSMKVPIPSNPFMLDFWNMFGMNAMQQPQNTAEMMSRIDPRVAASSSRRVVMFVMLFCVAMFLVFPHSSDIKFDSTTTGPQTTPSEETTNRIRAASRNILFSPEPTTDDKKDMVDVSIDANQQMLVDEEFKKNVASIYNEFVEVREAASQISVKDEEESESAPQKIGSDDIASQINVLFDADKISLTFPKAVLVKQEDSMADETSTNATTDQKISILSTKLLREICRVVRQ